MAGYDPRSHELLTFYDARAAFLDGRDKPRAYLERMLETLEAREPVVRAFTALNLDGARAAADQATRRYQEGRPLSLVDGLPIGIKDLFQTRDMPTQMNSPVYRGWNSGLDAACVHALRSCGAVIVGKTTTTEFGVGVPDVTTNPFDAGRTPGGSSSGSAAAVGARMLPAALGTQLGGSIVRPAAYCGNWAIKPSFGALNRSGGHSTSPSGSHLGVHAGSLEDVWEIAWLLSSVAGPDPGMTALGGRAHLPEAERPRRLIRLYTPGWERTDPASQAAFEDLLRRFAEAGVEILEPSSDPRLAAFEAAIPLLYDAVWDIAGYEMRWPLKAYLERGDDMLSPQLKNRLAHGEGMTGADYARALAVKERLRAMHAELAGLADGFVSPASPGPAPKGLGSTGDSVFQTPTSALGAPSMALPLMAVDGMPFGLQMMGFRGGDDRLMAQARWVRDRIGPQAPAGG